MQTLTQGRVERHNTRGGGGKCEETANVTRTSLFVFIPMALKFSKSNLATDMTSNSVLPQHPPAVKHSGGIHQETM